MPLDFPLNAKYSCLNCQNIVQIEKFWTNIKYKIRGMHIKDIVYKVRYR